MRKKATILSVLLVLALVLVFTACGHDASPSEVVKQDLDTLKSEESTAEALDSIDLDGSGLSEEDMNALVTKIQDFDYKIGEENIDGDTATVKVNITTYNLGQTMKDFYIDMVKQALTNGDASNISQEEITKQFIDKINGLDEKTYSKEVTINCTKGNDGWKSDCMDNDELEDAMLGGLNTTIEALDDISFD